MTESFMYKFKIKSRYTGEWQDRSIILDFYNDLLGITQYGIHMCKYFSIQEISMQLKSEEFFIISIKTGRVYQIKGHSSRQVFHRIKTNKMLNQIAKISFENNVSIPKNICYHKLINNKLESLSNNTSTISSLQIKSTEKVKQTKKSYLIEKDWKVNHEDGGLILISQQKKKNQGKILKFLLKKIVTTGSFMGISFPVFAMKPQSILQTYCKSIGSAPMLFDNCPHDKVERVKRFVVFIFTFSRLFSDMDKQPFNPVLGQTFQAKIGHGNFSAQQISHHPPQSSIFYEGLGYRIYSTLQLDAKIGINSATGCFYGDIVVQFEDGQKIIGRLLSGQMSGFLFGQNKFRPTGAYYAYDPINKIVCTYELHQKDLFRGCLGKLNDIDSLNFEQNLKNNERFIKFKGVASSKYKQIYSHLQASWTKYVRFDRKIMLDFNDPECFAYEPKREQVCLLDSDSQKREDIRYRQIGKHEQAQNEKEKIQQEERYLKKLRINFKQKSKG